MITRKEAPDEPYIMFFNIQFYSSKVHYGVSHVLNWNERKKNDIFSKKS
jgi:hypothetical protein